MRVDDIEYALTVARHGSLAKACGVLGISQPALSKAIARLEGGLKTSLFERQARGMKLTLEGRLFIEHAQRLVTSASDIRTTLRDVRHGNNGIVRFGVGIGVPPGLLTKPIERVASMGQVRFEITSGHSDTLLKDLIAGDLDLVITGISQPDDPTLEWRPLWDDPLVPFIPKALPLAEKSATWSMRTLRQQNWLLPPKGTPARKRFDSAFVTAGMEPPEALVESRGSGQTFELCLALGLVALVPRSLIQEKRVHENFVQVLSVSPLSLERTVAIISRTRSSLSPLTANFKSLIESFVGSARPDEVRNMSTSSKR